MNLGTQNLFAVLSHYGRGIVQKFTGINKNYILTIQVGLHNTTRLFCRGVWHGRLTDPHVLAFCYVDSRALHKYAIVAGSIFSVSEYKNHM